MESSKKHSLIIIGTDSESTNIAFHFLKDIATIEAVIIEKKINKKALIKGRIKKCGLLNTFGQIFFIVFVIPLLKLISQKRRIEILKKYNLNTKPIPSKIVVESVNSSTCVELLKNIQSDFVLLSGTRILSSKTLASIKATILNIHAGITPKYRGVHGAYHALANDDAKNCGVTLHLVDSGIDTGKIIMQETISPTNKDNFCTYPLLQLEKGLQLLKSYLRGEIKNIKTEPIPSKLWYHPTIWGYISNFKKAK